jgi:predicted NBD/HSP70 family sugar kinase
VSYFIGIDVGGTTTTIAIGNDRREVQSVADQFPTASEKGPEAVVRVLVEHALAAVESAGGAIDGVAGVCLATPGPATIDGVLLKSPNLAHARWDKFPIRAELERALQSRRPGVRVHYLGDGQAAALGEYAVRSRAIVLKGSPEREPPAEPISSLFMVIVGTGLGGGAVQDGRVVRGCQGRAGHIGHTTLPAHAFHYEHDHRLLVGNAYCTAESAISLNALTHQLEYRLSLDQWREHRLHGQSGSMRDKAKCLRELAADGDALALELFEDQARALGIALLNVNYLGDYDLLVIGGGVCDLAPAVREPYLRTATESYHRHALDGFKSHVAIEFSTCADDAPVIGALALVSTQSA